MTKQLTTTTATSGMMSILDAAEKVQANLTQAEGLQRAVAMACGLVELQAAMSDEVVAVLMALQGNPMGFRTDKVYSPDVVKACAIQALLAGAYLVDDEWQIIAGNVYLGQRFYLRKLREYPGVSDVEITVDLPETVTPSLLVCGGYAACRVDGKKVEVFARKSERFGDSRIAVTAHKGDVDQAQGKVKKRLAQRLYERIAGVTITDEGESVDLPGAEQLTLVEAPPAAAEQPPVDWKAELMSCGGEESQVWTIGCLLRDAPTQDDRDNVWAAACANRNDGSLEQRGFDVLQRYYNHKSE